jgi:subtilase family serine protease
MGLIRRPIRAGAIAVMGLAIIALTGMFGASALASPSSAAPQFVALKGSVPATTDTKTGLYQSAAMSIEVALAPKHQAQLNTLLASVYNSRSKDYEHWLAKGQFAARFAPSAATQSAVASYLRGAGLKVSASGSPFLVRASGSSNQVSSAFRTTLSNYRDNHGLRYFSNSTAVQVPKSLASGVTGVLGLTNTVREHSMVTRVDNVARPTGTKAASSSSGASASCETPYPTRAQLYNAVNNGVNFPYGYGGGPGCSGLTPSQTNSIYDAPNVGARGKGAGTTTAVFELSAYQQSDIDTWAHQFYGAGYNPPLKNINVDGGPLNPVCPTGDTCPPSFNGYAGDIEVDADIETQLAVSPDMAHLIVYNAPNDETGQTELDEYTAIANQDKADVISSSWAVCENDVDAAYVQAENTVFEQMAVQGQSMFGAEGDTGAFECIRSDGTTIVNVLDPPSQPWVTSVGGTSLESDNPGTNSHPSYPSGHETVWNVDSLCNTSANEGGTASSPDSGLFWCGAVGAGGGGSSQWWGRPFYQIGPGVNNPNTTYANGTTHCALAAKGTPCREDPDISANADEYTPYAEYCTGNANTPYSDCATFSGSQTPPGWFGIGGTSLSSPLWSAIIADRDSYQGHRSGNINPLLYLLFNVDPSRYFHDIGSFHNSPLTPSNNGLFPSTSGYDEATGIGTPIMAAIITGS